MRRKIAADKLLRMSDAERMEICAGCCETDLCPFEKALWKYREDGFCIADNLKFLDKWIKEEEDKIDSLERAVKKHKHYLAKYKRHKKIMQRMLGGNL